MNLLATTGATTYTVWLLLLWVVIIPTFAILPVMYALAQVAGERKENQAFARGERPADDADKVVLDA
ncbi:hypothetical protein [Patulibacter americanus]|jgi:hypothetical protein|uniref:hypothetical protein n=1 Tax=Patulibacter americanus TaxID=588672 RepID=UPI0003B63BA6|nr:hypothetical protein [Patulibacter americanus]